MRAPQPSRMKQADLSLDFESTARRPSHECVNTSVVGQNGIERRLLV